MGTIAVICNIESEMVVMPAPLVLLYNLDTPKGAKIRRMCLPLRLRTRLVRPEEYALPLSALVEGASSEATCPEHVFSDEMLLLAHLTGPQLNAFLEGFRRNKIPPVLLKAVLTDTNRVWDSSALHAELQRERQAIQSGGSAHAGS